jgi:hypothetical protein
MLLLSDMFSVKAALENVEGAPAKEATSHDDLLGGSECHSNTGLQTSDYLLSGLVSVLLLP